MLNSINGTKVQQENEVKNVLNFFNDGKPIFNVKKPTLNVTDDTMTASRVKSVGRSNFSNSLNYLEKIEIADKKSLKSRYSLFKSQLKTINGKEYRNSNGLSHGDLDFLTLLNSFSKIVVKYKDEEGNEKIERVAVKFAKRSTYSGIEIATNNSTIELEVNQDFDLKVRKMIKVGEDGVFYVQNEKQEFLTILRAEESMTFSQILKRFTDIKQKKQKKALAEKKAIEKAELQQKKAIEKAEKEARKPSKKETKNI